MSAGDAVVFAMMVGAGAYAVHAYRNRTDGDLSETQLLAVRTSSSAGAQPFADNVQASSKAIFAGLAGLFGGRGGGQDAPTIFRPPPRNTDQVGDSIDTVFGDITNGIADVTRDALNLPPATTQPSNIGARLMSDLMSDFRLTRPQAAGIVGSLHVESAGFATLQEITPMEWKNGQLVPSDTNRGGWGYAQWTGSRRRDFEAWADARGLDRAGYAANYGFLKHEMTNTWEKRVVPRLRKATNASEAAGIFTNTFLRPGIPHMGRRKELARGYV